MKNTTKNRLLSVTSINFFVFLRVGVTMLLCLIYMIGTSTALEAIISILFLVALLFAKAEEAFYHLMVILCANEMLNLGTTSLTMIFVALFTVKYWITNKVELTAGTFFSTYALLFYSILVYFGGSSEQLMTSVKQLFFFCFIFAVLKESQDHWAQLYGNTFRCVAIGILYFGFLSILTKGFPSVGVRYTFSEDVTINFLAIVCALTIVSLLYEKMVLNASKGNVILIIGCAFIGILTQSRSFILASLIGIFLIWLLTSDLKKKFKISVIICIGGIAILFLFLYMPSVSEYINAVLTRIVSPDDDDISNGRYVLWGATIKAMMNNSQYFWLGAGGFEDIGAVFEDKVMMAHNMFLESWVIYGVIGMLLVVVLFFCYIKHGIFNKISQKASFVSFVPLIVMLCALFYSHHFIGRSMSMVFVISWLPLVITPKKSLGR